MADMILLCYLLGAANNFLVVGLCEMGFMNFVSQSTGRTADGKRYVSSSSASESRSSSARRVKEVGGILL